VRSELTISNASVRAQQVLAKFSDGSLAAIKTHLDTSTGGVTRIAFSPGLTYLENATNWMRLPRRSEFSVALRELLLDAIGHPPQTVYMTANNTEGTMTAAPFVETALLFAKPHGAVLSVFNWDALRRYNQSSGLIHVAFSGLGFEPRKVQSAETGNELKWEKSGDGAILIKMHLDMADFVLLWNDSHADNGDVK
jgi:hypothetical protein